jgi:elongation factor P--(R)-beta-lysine ligase
LGGAWQIAAIMQRQTYLAEQWKPYPVMPANAEIAGRVSEIHLASGRIALLGKGEWILSTAAQFPLQVLVPGDWVAFEMKAGKVSELTLLAPALQEPKMLSSSQEIQRKWFEFLQQVRQFFTGKGFQEAQTPSLVVCPGTEPFLDLFSVGNYYLPTSPELSLKKMLAGGYEQIFEIRPCFRRGEISERHQPEFWMLEWYRAFHGLEQIMQDTLHLIEFMGGDVTGFQRKSMADLFQEKLQFHLTPKTSIHELKALADQVGLGSTVRNYEIWDDVFYLLFIEKIEPFLDSENPLIVEKYPPSQAALARLTEDGWGERFELYWKGFEIANAFHELNDPQIQAERFQTDLDLKKSLGKDVPSLDPDFLDALKAGMPPSGGIALGLERLFMGLHGIKDIRELRVFPYDRS